MPAGPEQSQSLVAKINQLVLLGKGTFVYCEFDSQATESDKALTIVDNTIRFNLPPNYYPVIVDIVAVDENGNEIYGIPISKITYDYDELPQGNRQVIAEPSENNTIDESKHWIAYVVCIGIDDTKPIVDVKSQSGSVEPKGRIYLINYSDTNGTDEITIQYFNGTSETITVDKANLWTVNPYTLG
ncbi:hypothetical protein QIT38_gp20 [Methanocaldococcus fervens tailed virus 1]|uniref:Uncharacterized protein n=2 Tax=root TaxID=1 RepID=C7P5I2_METFA|nr:hypothetical protein [Methanocaldococcus fervens]YP_010772315.1 hypothetical protein QIT38_gp20 [Methanocaldococcus fervens tailed virus 1]ACV25360.1 hypothetical protein Mefer_1557 [Methanocaldococcus fervens AG86]QNO11490.1 hypothetical protein [Methanocaldococcus fervens tailed virus 1]